ncbi:MAG: ABC transporter ATP-binding protein [Alphaproteobacteria bacterium]|nr:ABC transporter ATP-binding protein [Alphaproteobacteria bacterium]
MAMPLLQVIDQRTYFETGRGLLRAVDGVDFELHQGRTLGVVGESGCGKTVLARSIMGLLPSNTRVGEGSRIIFDGRDLGALDEKSLRALRGSEIAMIFQDPMTSLNPVLTVGKQIGETLIRHHGLSRHAARGRAVELLRDVGIPQPEVRVDQYPHQLSGGMRQRVAIAIALSCQPRLLIADEPTTALDVTVQADILDLLRRQQIERDMSMILITHDMGVVAGRSDEVAVMYAGRIVEWAETPELFRNTRMPYTAALLNSIPRVDDPPHRRIDAIAGRPPDLIHPPKGCLFAPRCGHVEQRCRRHSPPLQLASDGTHAQACWFPQSVGTTP